MTRSALRAVSLRAVALGALALAACRAGARPQARAPERYEPERDLGPLFQAVQLSDVFPDSKTLADATPHASPAQLVARYLAQKDSLGFRLDSFVRRNFTLPAAPSATGVPGARTMEQHIRALWSILRRPPDTASGTSSLIPLPETYVVPGGRFREMYYWDSYFTMLGLIASGRTDLVRSMLDDFAYLIRTVGHIPNGNRTYYLSRSQPPFFGAMIALYAAAADTARALPYLDALEREYAFWMEGARTLAPRHAWRRVVELDDGTILNRYWDDDPEPRPEAYAQDYRLARTVPAERREALYRNVRATAESGWDFSSRWMRDPRDLRTLETTDIVPVDLNSILYETERIMAALRRFRGAPGDSTVAALYDSAAARRRRALLAAAYETDSGFFYDVRWKSGERVVDRPTLAAAAPLFFGLATPEQGRGVAARLARDFLKPGGFVTTLAGSGQQWDAPNGWAPLEWLAIEGIRRYGARTVAEAARRRWLDLNRRVYERTGRMMEKYDVEDLARPAGGGEYPAQDGFGWTNGVVLALEGGARYGLTTARVPMSWVAIVKSTTSPGLTYSSPERARGP